MITAIIFTFIALLYAQWKVFEALLLRDKTVSTPDLDHPMEMGLIIESMIDERKNYRKKIFWFFVIQLISTLIKTIFVHGHKWL